MMPLLLGRRLNPEIYLPPAPLGEPPSGFEEHAAALAACGLRTTVHGPFADPRHGSENPLLRSQALATMRAALRAVVPFAPTAVVFHPDPIDKQDQMLGKMDLMIDKQDQMLGKMDQMLEKQDKTIDKLEDVRQDIVVEIRSSTDTIVSEIRDSRERSCAEHRESHAELKNYLDERLGKMDEEISRVKDRIGM